MIALFSHMGWLVILVRCVERNKRTLQMMLGIVIVLLILAYESTAQDHRGFIYGKVYTADNTYKGQIRWGKEEAFWNDLFNASKVSKGHYDHFRKEKEDSEDGGWLSLDWRLSSIWEDKHGYTVHQFVCQFGDIQSLTIRGGSHAVVELKNGVQIPVNGDGYNDIGTDILVLDEELGSVKLNWSRVEKVEFMEGPMRLAYTYGKPLFGTVKTLRKGDLTGFIQWDHDERLGKDKLDGDTRDGDVSIAFENITKIYRDNSGSHVTLNSGRTLYLTGSNDVDEDNRGVIVTVEGVGKIDVPWKVFRGVDFTDSKDSGTPYKEYTKPVGLKGRVYQYDNSEIYGTIIYDIDETWEIEMLEGKDDELEYHIPFRHIKRITPKNYSYSMIELRNGKSLLLGGGRDVSSDNDGVLIKEKDQAEPVLIPWNKITEIVFD